MMYRLLSIVLILTFLASVAFAEESLMTGGIVGKVITPKGSLNMRTKSSDKSKIIAEIPNGTCILVTEEGSNWCQVQWKGSVGYCKKEYLLLLREADPVLLSYRVLSKGDKGKDVLSIKSRLQELGYIRNGTKLTDLYNDTLEERLIIFQRQIGVEEDGIASQELQAYLFSDRAPICTETLPRPQRSQVVTEQTNRRRICGCCMGDGCDCCNYTGWLLSAY